MSGTRQDEPHARFLRLPDLPQIELHQRTRWTQGNPSHVHWVFAMTAIERGVSIEKARGRSVDMTPGSIALIEPGEAHAGDVPAGRHYSSRTVRIDAALLNRWLPQITGQRRNGFHLGHAIFRDQALSEDLLRLWAVLERPGARLEKEHALLAMIEALHARHGTTRPLSAPGGRERPAVKRACEFLQENYSENVSLDRLAALTGTTAFHLAKLFTREVGVPPHAFQIQVRLRKATEMLAAGQPQAQVALDAGFADQSHLCRAFKRRFGVPPGRYRH